MTDFDERLGAAMQSAVAGERVGGKQPLSCATAMDAFAPADQHFAAVTHAIQIAGRPELLRRSLRG